MVRSFFYALLNCRSATPGSVEKYCTVLSPKTILFWGNESENMEEILPLSEKTHPVGNGVQKLYRFENNYGASVVQFDGSYGSRSGLWELAVIKYDGEEYGICYDTPITDDVISRLSLSEVQKILVEIRDLKP